MLDDTTSLAKLRSLPEIVKEYDEKSEALTSEIAAYEQAQTDLQSACSIAGQYAGQAFDKGRVFESSMRNHLLQSAWRHVYHGLNIDKIAPASDRNKFEMSFKDPAPFTIDNIRATFGKYIVDQRGHILRGLAEAFGKLDLAFKSHDRMKVGVKGLPKRVIISNVNDYGGYGTDRLSDLLNAIRVYEGREHLTWKELREWMDNAKIEPAEFEGMTLKRFMNGNAHLHFSPDKLKSVNLALAEYYGEVLADCPEERPQKATGTAITKDLAFYRTPPAAVQFLLNRAEPRDGMRILEPSCGDGAILDGLRKYADDNRLSLRATGVEYDAERARQTEAKGFSVHCANFLQVEPSPTFDMVLMNPPFCGKHYQKHVEHARKFLKPDGVLYAILPITAMTDHGFVKKQKYGWDTWRDLPEGSFSESGTNINTGIARFWAHGKD